MPPSPAIRHFGNNEYSIVIENMEYNIGNTKEKIVVPNGFITDYASIPKLIKISGLSPHEQYSRAAIVHDFLYWSQGCTQDQADRLFFIAMEESEVDFFRKWIVYSALYTFGWIAWNQNTEERKDGLLRIIPTEYQHPEDSNMNWPDYQSLLLKKGFKDPPFEDNPSYCVYGNERRVP